MPFGVVLLADRRTHASLAGLAGAIGGGADPINLLGSRAPAHVSVVHFDGEPTQAAEVAARVARHPRPVTTVKFIGLLYAVLAAGDYYVPQGGVYFGLEVVRRPDLDALHTEVLDWLDDAGAAPLGAVGADYRPHFTLGVTATRPVLPDLAGVPTGEVDVTLAVAELGPYGTFPGLSPA
jgi:hypothetical protein